MESKEDRIMKKNYAVVLDAKHPVTKYLEVHTDSFEEVDQLVNQWVWNYSSGRIVVWKKEGDEEKEIKNIILVK